MSVPTGESWWSHANNKAVMCWNAQVQGWSVEEFFFLPKCPHVDSWPFNGPLNCSGPFVPKHHCKLMLRWQSFFFYFKHLFLHFCDRNFVVDETHPCDAPELWNCVKWTSGWRTQSNIFGGVSHYELLKYSSGWNTFITIRSQAETPDRNQCLRFHWLCLNVIWLFHGS